MSPDSDGSFYSATDSPTGQAPAMHPEPTFDLSLCREGPFAAANPTLGLGTTRVVVHTGSRPTGILIVLWFTASPPTVPGVGGGTGICPLNGPGPQ